MKRILVGYVEGNNSCGIDTYLFNVIRVLIDNNYRFDLLTNEINDNLRCFCEETGCGLFEIPSLKQPIKRYFATKRIIGDGQYDAVYLNISEAFNSIDAIAAKHCKIKKVIVHSHAAGANESSASTAKIKRGIHNFFKTFILGHYVTDLYACSSLAAKWMFTKKMIDTKGVKIVSNAVDRARYVYNPAIREQMRRELNIEDNFVLGNISGFTPAKNISFLIDILKEAVEINQKVKLLLIGAGREFDAVQEKVRTLQLEEYVLFLGRRKDVSNLLQAMDVFVFPSIVEGLGIVAVEAQMAGLKVYASDTLPREVRITEKCTFLSLEQPAKEWAEQILSEQEYDRAHTELLDDGFDLQKQKEVLLELF